MLAYRRSVPRTLLAAAALLAAGAPHAVGAQLVEVGTRTGVTSSTVVWDTPGPQSSQANRSRRALTIGAFMRYRLASAFSLQPELLLVQKGFERTQPTHHFTYLELPLLARADFGGRGLGGFLLGGAAVAYELACRVSYVSVTGAYRGDCDAPNGAVRTTRTRDWDVGAVLGGGVIYPVGAGRVTLDARYTQGLRDIGVGVPGERMLNRSVALTAGYAVRLSR